MSKFITITLASTLFLTGCISTRSTINDGLDVLEGEHSTITDPAERFSIELPTGFELIVVQDENDATGARLLAITPEGGSAEDAVVVLEENIVQTEEVISELLSVDAITQRSRETFDANGVQADVLKARLTSTGKNTEYIFIRPGNRTYIFSLPGGESWGYYQSVAKTLKHLQDAPAAKAQTVTRDQLPEISGIEVR